MEMQDTVSEVLHCELALVNKRNKPHIDNLVGRNMYQVSGCIVHPSYAHVQLNVTVY